MNKIAFLTTIFPMNKKYLIDCFNSLDNQTYKEFDLIVLNDGYKEFFKIESLYNNLNIKEIEVNSSPVKNREIGINYCIKNGYDILIFGDSDDFFANNRIEKSMNMLKFFDIVLNDLTLFSENGIISDKYISNRLTNKAVVDFDYIKNKNIFGLSNTAINLKGLRPFSFPIELKVLDWFLFSTLLILGKKAVFINETSTYYRQYDDNLIGLKTLTKEDFEKIKKMKIGHYTAMFDKFEINFFKRELKRLSKINYHEKKEIKNPLWWELI